MAKRNGWIRIKGVIIVAIVVVLALGTWAGVQFLTDRGEQERRGEAISEAEKRLDEIASRDVESETPDESTEGSEQSSDDEDSDKAAAAGELPETGPGDTAAVVAIAALAFTVSSFAMSRRQVRASSARHL